MATYQANITKNIEPAMANPATLQQAGASTRAAITTLSEGAQTLYKGYVEQELSNVEQGAANIAQEMFISGQAASVAGRQLSQLQAQQPAAGSMFAEAMMGAQGEDVQQRAAEQLKSYDVEISRLKAASEGGMSNEQYVSRIDTLTKKAIAQYPGLANQIREKVGAVTGMPYADRWAQMNYVKERFSKVDQPKQKTPRDMAMQDIDKTAELGTFGTREELLNLYDTNRAEYDVRMTGFKTVLQTQTQVNNVKNTVSALSGQSDFQADQARQSFSAVFAGSLGTNVLTTSIKDKEQTFADTLQLMSKGDPKTIDPTKFQVLVSLHTSQMRTNIEQARKSAYNVIDAYIANNPNISDAKRKELYADQDRQAEQSFRMYADDKGVGMLAMANVLKTYRDKSLSEQQMVLDLAIKQQTAMQNNPMVMAFYGLGDSRENLKLTNVDFYNFMVKQEKTIQDAVRGIRGDVSAATDLANVERVVLQSEQSGSAIPVDRISPPEVTRAAHQALLASAAEILKKTNLATSEVNAASAAFSTSVATGANSQILAKDYRKFGEQIAKLPDSDQAVIKSNTSKSVSGAVMSINEVKQTIETKYKVSLNLGVNDAGEISVIRQPVPAGVLPRESNVTTYNVAAAEFMKQTKPMLNNVVYGTAMLTRKEAKAVGTEFATIINNKQPYAGFYQSEPQPVAPTAQPQPTAPSTTGAVDMDAQVKATIAKMKEKDPELNTDYLFNAYTRASPEEKKKLTEMFKNNSMRMADLSGAGK